MLDTDLAVIYGVQTKRLNEQVKRNLDRFPDDFMFQLTADELAQMILPRFLGHQIVWYNRTSEGERDATKTTYDRV